MGLPLRGNDRLYSQQHGKKSILPQGEMRNMNKFQKAMAWRKRNKADEKKKILWTVISISSVFFSLQIMVCKRNRFDSRRLQYRLVFECLCVLIHNAPGPGNGMC